MFNNAPPAGQPPDELENISLFSAFVGNSPIAVSMKQQYCMAFENSLKPYFRARVTCSAVIRLGTERPTFGTAAMKITFSSVSRLD